MSGPPAFAWMKSNDAGSTDGKSLEEVGGVTGHAVLLFLIRDQELTQDVRLPLAGTNDSTRPA